MATYYTVAESNNDRKNRLLWQKIKDVICINSREFPPGILWRQIPGGLGPVVVPSSRVLLRVQVQVQISRRPANYPLCCCFFFI